MNALAAAATTVIATVVLAGCGGGSSQPASSPATTAVRITSDAAARHEMQTYAGHYAADSSATTSWAGYARKLLSQGVVVRNAKTLAGATGTGIVYNIASRGGWGDFVFVRAPSGHTFVLTRGGTVESYPAFGAARFAMMTPIWDAAASFVAKDAAWSAREEGVVKDRKVFKPTTELASIISQEDNNYPLRVITSLDQVKTPGLTYFDTAQSDSRHATFYALSRSGRIIGAVAHPVSFRVTWIHLGVGT